MLHRPLFSIMIPTYNCAGFLKETLAAVFESGLDVSQAQIEVIDDQSTKDDPEEVVRQFGRGVASFYRQPENVGISRNFNTCIERARGELVHILHGDDIVLPGFYRAILDLADQFPNRGFFFTRCTSIDENGIAIGTTYEDIGDLAAGVPDKDRLYLSNRLSFPGIVVRKSLYDRIGPFRTELRHLADWEMWTRCILAGGVAGTADPLAGYRIHSGSDTTAIHAEGIYLDEFETLFHLWSHADANFPRVKFRRMLGRNELVFIAGLMKNRKWGEIPKHFRRWFVMTTMCQKLKHIGLLVSEIVK